jgi:hypothetical protein
MAIEKSYIDMLKERDAKIEALKELLRLSHESLDSKDKKIAELSLKACTLDLTKGHLTQCEAALESRDELNETLSAKIAELEKNRKALIIVDLKGDAIVMANARRLIKANVRTSNGRLYSELFGTGCGSGRSACRELGLNPDCNKTSYEEMCNHINSKALKEQE